MKTFRIGVTAGDVVGVDGRLRLHHRDRFGGALSDAEVFDAS